MCSPLSAVARRLLLLGTPPPCRRARCLQIPDCGRPVHATGSGDTHRHRLDARRRAGRQHAAAHPSTHTHTHAPARTHTHTRARCRGATWNGGGGGGARAAGPAGQRAVATRPFHAPALTGRLRVPRHHEKGACAQAASWAARASAPAAPSLPDFSAAQTLVQDSGEPSVRFRGSTNSQHPPRPASGLGLGACKRAARATRARRDRDLAAGRPVASACSARTTRSCSRCTTRTARGAEQGPAQRRRPARPRTSGRPVHALSPLSATCTRARPASILSSDAHRLARV